MRSRRLTLGPYGAALTVIGTFLVASILVDGVWPWMG